MPATHRSYPLRTMRTALALLTVPAGKKGRAPVIGTMLLLAALILPNVLTASAAHTVPAGAGAAAAAGVAPNNAWGWGENNAGQVGDGTTTNVSTPMSVVGIPDAVAIAGGGAAPSGQPTSGFSLALRSNGTVWSWGNNSSGQLGDKSTASSSVPVEVVDTTGNPISTVVAIAAGGDHSVALEANGSVWSWGDNQENELGDGTVCVIPLPICRSLAAVQVSIPASETVTAIAAGAEFSLALMADGTVWGWGSNKYGQLGNATKQTATPVQAQGISGVTAITTGAWHTLALKGDGTLWAWGNNDDGQLGISSTVSQIAIPGQVVQSNGLPFTGVTAIAAGDNHSLALTTGGAAWAWGDNQYGQLGNTAPICTANVSLPCSLVPLQVLVAQNGAQLSGVTALAGGGNHSLALTPAAGGGTQVWGWGLNQFGQLGNGTTANSTYPLPVAIFPGPEAIAAGENHSLAIATGPTVSVSPSSIDFGSQMVGTTSPTQTVLIVNTSAVSVTIYSAAVVNAGFVGFVGTTTCLSNLVLPPNGSCTVGVSFAPLLSGTYTGTVTIVDSAAGSPQQVALSGIAQPLPTNTPTNTPLPVPTNTPVTPPSNTPVTLPTNTPTSTDTPAPTSTPLPTNTPVTAPSNTPVTPPTNTPGPTNTSTPTNTPLPTDTPLPTHTPITPPSNTPVTPPTNTPVVKQPTGGRTRTPSLSFHVKPLSVVSGQTLTVSVHTAAHAQVTMSVQVKGSKTVTSGSGKHRKRVTRTVVLYTAKGQGKADSHGNFTGHLRITYKPSRSVQATLTVSARTSGGSTTHTARVTIQPPPRKRSHHK